MAAIPWMPLYIADYLADTGHLGTIDHGAYFLMMMHYWTKGPLPADDGQLRKIARMTPREWADARGVLLDFFQLDGSVYRHKRIDAELATANELIDAKSKAGSAGAAKRWQKHKHPDGRANTSAIAEPHTDAQQTQCARTAHLPSPSPSKAPSLRDGDARAKTKRSLPEGFPDEDAQRRAVAFWTEKQRLDLAHSVRDEAEHFRDHHTKLGNRFPDWPAAWRTWMRTALTYPPKDRPHAGRRESPLIQSDRVAKELLDEFNARDSARNPDAHPRPGLVVLRQGDDGRPEESSFEADVRRLSGTNRG